MKVYHADFETDEGLERAVTEANTRCGPTEAALGSYGFGNTPGVLILVTDREPTELYDGVEYRLVADEAGLVKEETGDEQPAQDAGVEPGESGGEPGAESGTPGEETTVVGGFGF